MNAIEGAMKRPRSVTGALAPRKRYISFVPISLIESKLDIDVIESIAHYLDVDEIVAWSSVNRAFHTALEPLKQEWLLFELAVRTCVLDALRLRLADGKLLCALMAKAPLHWGYTKARTFHAPVWVMEAFSKHGKEYACWRMGLTHFLIDAVDQRTFHPHDHGMIVPYLFYDTIDPYFTGHGLAAKLCISHMALAGRMKIPFPFASDARIQAVQLLWRFLNPHIHVYRLLLAQLQQFLQSIDDEGYFRIPPYIIQLGLPLEDILYHPLGGLETDALHLNQFKDLTCPYRGTQIAYNAHEPAYCSGERCGYPIPTHTFDYFLYDVGDQQAICWYRHVYHARHLATLEALGYACASWHTYCTTHQQMDDECHSSLLRIGNAPLSLSATID